MSVIDSITSLFRDKAAGTKKRSDGVGAEHRATRRIKQRMRTGFVWNEKLITARPCMFKDLSMRGARVEILGNPIRPGLFAEGLQLYFDTEKHEVPCSVVWVRGRVVGLKFEGKPRPPSRAYR